MLGGTPAGIALTVTAMFGVSAAAIGAIVHAVLANQRAQARLASATASLASAPMFIAEDRGYFRNEGFSVEFKWFGLQSRVENHIMNTEQRVFALFHR